MPTMKKPQVNTFWTFYKDYAYRLVGDPEEYRYYIKKEGCDDENQSAETYELVGTANIAARSAIDAVSAISSAAGHPFALPEPEPEVKRTRTRRTKK